MVKWKGRYLYDAGPDGKRHGPEKNRVIYEIELTDAAGEIVEVLNQVGYEPAFKCEKMKEKLNAKKHPKVLNRCTEYYPGDEYEEWAAYECDCENTMRNKYDASQPLWFASVVIDAVDGKGEGVGSARLFKDKWEARMWIENIFVDRSRDPRTSQWEKDVNYKEPPEPKLFRNMAEKDPVLGPPRYTLADKEYAIFIDEDYVREGSKIIDTRCIRDQEFEEME